MLLELPWGFPVDVCSIGILVKCCSFLQFNVANRYQTLELLEGRNLLGPTDQTHNQYFDYPGFPLLEIIKSPLCSIISMAKETGYPTL